MVSLASAWRGRLLAGSLTVVSSLTPLPAGASEIPASARWHQSLVTILDTEFKGTGYQARWQYFNCPCGDVLIQLEEGAPEGVQNGELLLVAGRVVAGRGAVAETEDLTPMLHAPALMMHLVSNLLERALPAGPAAVSSREELFFAEPSVDIELDTGLATGVFPAPWQVSGSAWASGPGRRRFELSFSFANPQADDLERVDAITLSGGQDYLASAFPLVDEASMVGWNLQWLSRPDEPAQWRKEALSLAQLRTMAVDEPVDAAPGD